MFRYILVVLVLLFPIIASATEAPVCGPYAAIKAELENKHYELSLGAGMTLKGNAFELYIAPIEKTWTGLIINRWGLACLLVAGNGWTFNEINIKKFGDHQVE